MEPYSVTVAVIGLDLGVAGLATVKNLVEEGFNVTGFDRNPYVGGLWHYTEGDQTSVLPSTIINISKERGCFSDFPFPRDVPSHATAATVQRYLEDYVEHFNLGQRLRLGSQVRLVRRGDDEKSWEVWVEGQDEPLHFDKVVMANGPQAVPVVPELVGADIFTGETLHSRAYKKPELYKGKKVLVVGLCNSGVDAVASLQGHADKVYLAYRHGAHIIPRKVDGVPFDHGMTMRKFGLLDLIEASLPNVATFMTDKGLSKISQSAFASFRPEWRLQPAPSIKHCIPVITDTLIPLLESGGVQPVNVIKRAVGPRELELADGERIEVDAVIWCTGYQLDFSSMLDSRVDPTRETTPEWAAAAGSKGRPLPRLYRGIFSLDHPDSLAFVGCITSGGGFFPLADLASMALAQVWKGNSALPSREEMGAAVNAWHAELCGVARRGTANPLSVRYGAWQVWANEAAGTGLNEKFGWGVEGWSFWLRERRFYGLLMDGIYTPQVLRLFDGKGKRKAWEGARAEIERVNELAKKDKAA